MDRDTRRGSVFRLFAVVLALVTLVPSACSEGPTDETVPTPATMIATVLSPNGDEGSAILEVTGGSVFSATATESDVAVYLVGAAPQRLVVLRRLPGAIELQVDVDDQATFDVSVVEVGDPDDGLRSDVSGYSVALRTGAGG